MKKLIYSVLATIFVNILSVNAQDTNYKLFFNSSEFKQFSKTFEIESKDIDLDNYASMDHESKTYKIYRVLVNENGNKNFLTFFSDDNGQNYALVYEKINLSKKIAEHYDEYGNLYANFTVNKTNDQLFAFKINKVNSLENITTQKNKKSGCIEKNYQILKKACESDDMCDMLCDLQPFCHGMLFYWAVAFCATR
ncbi:MAG: hypothetical protein O9282_09580 [Flavobacterium sp.]|jgi:hypothetical protein|uniref:hypothetical protein n=1 Tax=Flavobacterium sp. TaxID=239 RepID=UPI0022C9D69A|nr:hypothetical protein [Flavobacterium sp.]MCZ8090246.1 hypothetical protein [Flavobacterium sp.]MCZ8331549.1 hypothetical protein [Flavobacterium sp.]